MSDGISDGFPFSHKEDEPSIDKTTELLKKYYVLHIQKDARIKKLEALLQEIRDWYTLPSSDLQKRIDEVLK